MSMDYKENLTDSEIIKQVVAGDHNKYSDIVKRYESKLLRYAFFLSKDYDTASDLVQESFIKAYINLRSFDLSKQFSPWIYRILHNEAMNLIKRNKKILDIDISDQKNITLKTEFETDNIIDNNMLKSDVQNCLQNLDLKYKEAIILYYFNSLKYEEVGEILHIPTSTVGVRISRGKQILKKICQQKGVKYE